MEVHFKPDVQAKLERMARETDARVTSWLKTC
jgi:hypothetical protein